jgi:hypothetical protein
MHMADPINLSGDIANAVNGAAERGSTLVVGYIGDDGFPALSFRGSTQVRGPQQLAFWARNRDAGIAKAIADRPQVSLLFYESDGPGPRYLSLQGRAHVDPSADDAVYANMIEGERKQDPERAGVAVIIDVDSVRGFGANGPFQMQRDAD